MVASLTKVLRWPCEEEMLLQIVLGVCSVQRLCDHSSISFTVLQNLLCTKPGTAGYGSASPLARGFVTCGSTAAYHRGGLHSAEINYSASRHKLMPALATIQKKRKDFCMWKLDKEL